MIAKGIAVNIATMDENLTIPKDRILPASQDYDFLRSEGLKHIEELGSSLWTDYNEHDPGITILEALCYAITELGYRNGFDMKDLLSKDDNSIVDNQVFFTAKNILTNNPLTINDYRKLLIDIEGVHNAWLLADDTILDAMKNPVAVNEVPLYADCKNDALTTHVTTHPLYLSGLYRVLLDLDQDDRFGDLNNGEVVVGNPANANFIDGEFKFSIDLPSWKDADFVFTASAIDKNNIDTIITAREGSRWKCTLTLTGGAQLVFNINLSKKPDSKQVQDADIGSMFDSNKDFVAGVFKYYLDKIIFAKNIVQVAVKKLQERRNLCEDYLSVTTIDDEKIAFCFDIDVTANTDIEKVQAEVFYAIENYLNPSVEFLSLKELLDKNVPTDEIFNGTVLEHGFIDTLQLESTQLRTVIHTSDIINLLMDIDGVLAIRNFSMTKYDDDGKPVLGFIGLKWCMDITLLHKPVLSIDSSKILLFKNQFPFIANYAEVHDTLAILYAERSRDKLKGLYNDLAMPQGEKRDTESYWPVQYDFPQTYGIGQYGLPANATDERIAQQRQLKGYLMFYEQLLADFFSQLTQAHKLFSVADIKSTYYAQFLMGVKDLDSIYKSSGSTVLLQDIINNADSTIDPKNGWQNLYEPKDDFEERRNRFLDHLLARFGESFNDYALMMYRINYSERTEEKISLEELIAAKIKTLKNYDIISSQRGKAFNYFPQNDDFTVNSALLWDTDNVSGLEKRISFLTGINDYTRRFLYCIANMEIVCTEETVEVSGQQVLKCFHTFSFTSLSGIAMTSSKYENKADAEKAAMDAASLGADKDNYLFDATDSTLEIIGHSNETLAKSTQPFSSKDSAMTAAEIIAVEFAKGCNDPVGLHLIEHILLRPRDSDPSVTLLQVCLNDCDCICEEDPYTFRASVVLPYWPGHFDSMPFREYFENKIREEAPAHIMLKVCWLNNDLMRGFEICYKAWIEALAAWSYDKTTNLPALKIANNNMIAILQKLHSEYPVATLHDCVESAEGSNTVILGKTILGTFKN